MLDDPYYVRDLIGTAFAYGGRGPYSYDCYGLVREMFRRSGKRVPDYDSPSGNVEIMAAIMSGLQQWVPTDRKPGVMVVLTLPMTLHCGFVLPHDKMVHAWRMSNGVCVEPLSTWELKVAGYYEYSDSI